MGQKKVISSNSGGDPLKSKYKVYTGQNRRNFENRSKIHLLVAFLRSGTGISENSLKSRSEMAVCVISSGTFAPQLSPMSLNGYNWVQLIQGYVFQQVLSQSGSFRSKKAKLWLILTKIEAKSLKISVKALSCSLFTLNGNEWMSLTETSIPMSFPTS